MDTNFRGSVHIKGVSKISGGERGTRTQRCLSQFVAAMHLWAYLWADFSETKSENKKPLKFKGFLKNTGGDGGIRITPNCRAWRPPRPYMEPTTRNQLLMAICVEYRIIYCEILRLPNRTNSTNSQDSVLFPYLSHHQQKRPASH